MTLGAFELLSAGSRLVDTEQDHVYITKAEQGVHLMEALLCCVGLRVLIYSGDHDMCVPHTGSEAWTRGLGLKVKQAWHPWKVNHQVWGL